MSLPGNNNNSDTTNQNFPFEFEGVIQKSGITIYMYGSHTITNGNKLYALQSIHINLDLYIDQKVKVKGAKITGYPVDSGPELIDVKAVEKK